jgi:sugar phosphate isomerase/epimerase
MHTEPMRLGICADLSLATEVAFLGYDYIEGNLTALADMAEKDFFALCARMRDLPICAEAFNCMLPASLPVTGPNVSAGAIHAHLDRAFERAVQLGAEVVVFGSGGARSSPEGWPMDVAWRQIVNFLRMAERHNAVAGLICAIEPLRRQESNLINLVTEAMALASIVQQPHVRVLADSYHMKLSHEPYSVFEAVGPMLAHVHTANSIGRTFPKDGDGEDYRALFAALKGIGYAGRVSVEGQCEDFSRDAAQALKVLTEARESA